MRHVVTRELLTAFVTAACLLVLGLSATGSASGQTEAAGDTEPSARAPGDRDRPKIGLALSGGGARGCAHIGVLRVLEEAGLRVDYVAGTSMGSIIGGLYASGYSADELAELMESIDWATAMRDRPPRSDLSFRRKQDSLRFPLDLELGLRGADVLWPQGLSAGQNLFVLLRSFTLPVADVENFDRLPIPFRAVAADLRTGERVVLGRGDLAKALRASMAIPGYFTPVELDGRTLVDGGVVDNLPIDVVRSMGADLVIAVALSDPLDQGEFDSMMDVVAQTQAMLTKRNVDPQLARADLVIRPEVDNYGLLNFEPAHAIIEAGAVATRTRMDELALLIGEPVQRAPSHRPPSEPSLAIDRVRIEGDTRVDHRVLEAQLGVRGGEILDLERLSEVITRIYRLGDFESVEYELRTVEAGVRELVLQVRDKPWGPNYLRFGLQLEADLDGELSLGAHGAYTKTRLNSRGGEWRLELGLGTERGLRSEFYQPLDFGGKWFVLPQAGILQDRVPVYEGGALAADLDVRRIEAGLYFGRQFDEVGEVRLGLSRGRADLRIESGALPLASEGEPGELDFGGLVLELTVDRLDRAVLPRQGHYAKLQAFRAEEELGSEVSYSRLSVESAHFKSRGRHTFFAGLQGGWSPGGDLPLYDEFRVGGLLSLSGFQDGELRGQEFGVLRSGYAFEWRSGGSLARRVLLGGWVEAGQVWRAEAEPDLDDLIYTATVAIAAETWLGPVFLAYGTSEEGSDRFYLGIGRSF